MAVDATGTKNEPIFYATGAPEVDVDPSAVATYAAKVGNRRVDTTAMRTAATGKDVWEGLEWYDTDLDEVYLYTGAGWKLWHKQWTAYTPTTANVTGSPTITARYAVASGIVRVKIHVLLNGANFGTNPTFTLPITALTILGFEMPGIGAARDISPSAIWLVAAGLQTTTTVGVAAMASGAGVVNVSSNVSAVSPFTWAAGDMLNIDFTYEAA